MTIIRVRLDDADRKQYGDGEPLSEELVFDTEWLKDQPAGDIEAMEAEAGLFLVNLLYNIETDSQYLQAAFTRRALTWLAVRQAGHTPTFAEFQPQMLRAVVTREARPPAGPSEASSEA